ncbi:hypothetical protein [Falsiroseomonas oryziterrae]|uniref:hypothetical protein n=1 Tax=Falsiroseomonas oryziterrae TaxID=2911368 RepID=UPI001F161887|nr:hypothetical protein [Roseomonas sp. NPKOSM-4]
MKPALALVSRLTALVGGLGSPRTRPAAPMRPVEPAAPDPAADKAEPGQAAAPATPDEPPPLAANLKRDAWIGYDAPGEPSGERQVTIRSLHGTRGPDGFPEIREVGAWSHDEQKPRRFLIDRIRALRGTRLGPALTRAADIGMWLRAEAGLLHQRDIDRLKALRRRDEEERDEARHRARAAGGRRALRPTAVRVVTMHDDAPGLHRTDDGVLLSADFGDDGAPRVIFVGATAEARRGRPIRLGEAGRETTGSRLVSLTLLPDETRVPDIRAWITALPARPE